MLIILTLCLCILVITLGIKITLEGIKTAGMHAAQLFHMQAKGRKAVPNGDTWWAQCNYAAGLYSSTIIIYFSVFQQMFGLKMNQTAET